MLYVASHLFVHAPTWLSWPLAAGTVLDASGDGPRGDSAAPGPPGCMPGPKPPPLLMAPGASGCWLRCLPVLMRRYWKGRRRALSLPLSSAPGTAWDAAGRQYMLHTLHVHFLSAQLALVLCTRHCCRTTAHESACDRYQLDGLILMLSRCW